MFNIVAFLWRLDLKEKNWTLMSVMMIRWMNKQLGIILTLMQSTIKISMTEYHQLINRPAYGKSGHFCEALVDAFEVQFFPRVLIFTPYQIHW